jgi:hypothetical protein
MNLTCVNCEIYSLQDFFIADCGVEVLDFEQLSFSLIWIEVRWCCLLSASCYLRVLPATRYL